MANRNATRNLIEFVQSYIDLQEKHLDAIHKTMRETVDGVMAGIEEISKTMLQRNDDEEKPIPDSMISDLERLLLSMMGQLSRDDIIKQRIEHIRMALQALQTNLIYVLDDYEKRCSDREIKKFVFDLKSFVLRTYTMEEERRLHFEVFLEDKRPNSNAS